MERFEHHEYLLSGALDSTLSSAESDTFALLLQSSPVIQREYAELRRVENMLVLHAHTQTATTAAFREEIRSQLRSSLQSSMQEKNKDRNNKMLLLSALLLLLVGSALWWQYSSDNNSATNNPSSVSADVSVQKQQPEITSEQHRVSSPHGHSTTDAHSYPTNSAPSSASSATSPAAQVADAKDKNAENTQDVHPSPAQRPDAIAAKIQGADEVAQLRRHIETTTNNVQQYLQKGNLHAAATDAKRTALLYEKTGDISNARSWLSKALGYAHDSGVKEQEAELCGESALFESRQQQSAKAKELREQCLKLLDNNTARARWEEALRHIQ